MDRKSAAVGAALLLLGGLLTFGVMRFAAGTEAGPAPPARGGRYQLHVGVGRSYLLDTETGKLWGRDDKTDWRPSATPPGEALAARLKIAREVWPDHDRNETLVRLAGEAAAAGDGEITAQALEAICSDELRNETRDEIVERCALGLARAGMAPAAGRAANKIQDLGRRQAVLTKIARGELGP
jgi:hypothetical protein